MSSEETQQAVTEEAQEVVPAPTHNPEDVAAMFFKMNQTKLKYNLSQLSMKQLKRVIYTAASYPLIDNEYSPRTPEENTTIYIMNEMLNQKMIMTMTAEMQKVEEAQRIQNEKVIEPEIVKE